MSRAWTGPALSRLTCSTASSTSGESIRVSCLRRWMIWCTSSATPGSGGVVDEHQTIPGGGEDVAPSIPPPTQATPRLSPDGDEAALRLKADKARPGQHRAIEAQ